APVLSLGACYEKEGAVERARDLYAHALARVPAEARGEIEKCFLRLELQIESKLNDEVGARLAASKQRLEAINAEIAAAAKLPEGAEKDAKLKALQKRIEAEQKT